MRVVIDTNVLVSGLLSPYGAPGRIVNMAVSGELDICYDARVITEYREVLLRPKFSFERGYVGPIIEYIECFGVPVSAKPLSRRLRDPNDEPFLEVAIAGSVDMGAPVEDAEIRREDISISFAPVTARRVRVRALGAGACPSWHPEAGKTTWIFIDEVAIGE